MIAMGCISVVAADLPYCPLIYLRKTIVVLQRTQYRPQLLNKELIYLCPVSRNGRSRDPKCRYSIGVEFSDADGRSDCSCLLPLQAGLTFVSYLCYMFDLIDSPSTDCKWWLGIC